MYKKEKTGTFILRLHFYVSFEHENYNEPLIFVKLLFRTVLIGLSTIIILSTCYDYWHKDYQTKSDLLASFSFYTNTKELLEIDHSPPKNIITCFYGLRVIAALLIVLRHRFFQMPMSRHMDYDDFYMKFRTDIGRYAVNVFFLLAAILVTRTLMVTFEK